MELFVDMRTSFVSTNRIFMVLFKIPMPHSYVNGYVLVDEYCLPGGDCHEHDYKWYLHIILKILHSPQHGGGYFAKGGGALWSLKISLIFLIFSQIDFLGIGVIGVILEVTSSSPSSFACLMTASVLWHLHGFSESPKCMGSMVVEWADIESMIQLDNIFNNPRILILGNSSGSKWQSIFLIFLKF